MNREKSATSNARPPGNSSWIARVSSGRGSRLPFIVSSFSPFSFDRELYFTTTRKAWVRMDDTTNAERGEFLTTKEAGRKSVVAAWIMVGISILVFLTTLPFAGQRWIEIPGFVPMYVAILI